MKKFILKMAAKWFLPNIKEKLIEYVKSEELQKEYVGIINNKMDIPDVTEETEEQLLNAGYDALQELAIKNIDKLDIDKILKKISVKAQ